MNGMKLLKRHLAASSLAPLEAPRLPWGVLHPRQESEPAGGRQSRACREPGGARRPCCHEAAESPAKRFGWPWRCCLLLTVLYDLYFSFPP